MVRFIAFAAGILALALTYGVHRLYTDAELDRAIVAWSNSYIWDAVGSTSAPAFADQAVEPGPADGTWQIKGVLTAARGDGSRLHGRYVAVLQKTCSVVDERSCWRLADLSVEGQPIAAADSGFGNGVTVAELQAAQSESLGLPEEPESDDSILPAELIQPQPAAPTLQESQSGELPIDTAAPATPTTEGQTVAPPPVIVTAMAEGQAAQVTAERPTALQLEAAETLAPEIAAAQQDHVQTVGQEGRRLPSIPAPQVTTTELQDGAATRVPQRADPATVLAIQQHLVTQNIYNGPLDADMGPATRDAIQAYQRRHGLEPDGIPSDTLLAHLDRQGGPASPTDAAATNLAPFKVVESSAVRTVGTVADESAATAPAAGPESNPLPTADESLVFLVQDRLHALGYGKNSPLPRDGQLNQRTQQAIAAYQRKNGLQETGLPSAALLDHIERYVKRLRSIEQGGTGAVARAEPASAVAAVPSTGSGNGSSGYEAFRLAMGAMQSGQTERAIVLFSRAIQSNDWREKHQAYLLRGNAFTSLGNHRQAVNDFSAALLLKPDYVEALVRRGSAYAKLNQPEMAIADYRKGQALDPDNPIVAAEMAKLAAGN